MITVGVRFLDGAEQELAQCERVVEANDKLEEAIADYDDLEYAYLEMAGYDLELNQPITDRYARLYPEA